MIYSRHLLSVLSAIIIASLVCIALPLKSHADYVIATVNMDKILNETKAAEKKKEELARLKEEKKKAIEKEKKALISMKKKLAEQKLPEDSPEVIDYKARAKDLARLAKDAEEELRRQYLRSTRELLQKARIAIKKYAKENGINLVLEQGGAEKSSVVYSSNALDITDKIIAILNSD
ncbi:MAG: OmpH family outer membrane protein [Candidatus Dadabacteria bacterium]|nr:MAG: OmpH family outer membrane protein [Candidatus Dadabacteria bacterium]